MTSADKDPKLKTSADAQDFKTVLTRLATIQSRDALISSTTTQLREKLKVDRVALYYFYRKWKGQVTYEALSSDEFSILGTSGPDDCFNDDYAALYLEGRYRAIANIEVEPIANCHRDFLRSMGVRANLVTPILTEKGLWGLLVAHHCTATRKWSQEDVELIMQGAKTLADATAIKNY